MRTFALFAAGTFLVLACKDSVGPFSMEEVAGVYAATTLELEDTVGVVDAIADGGSIDLTLTADGRSTGQLFVVGGNPDGSDFVADLRGTWTLDGPIVTLVHSSNSFLRDVGLLYTDGKLSGQREENFTTITVVLTRTP